jgi:hypothetical protein
VANPSAENPPLESLSLKAGVCERCAEGDDSCITSHPSDWRKGVAAEAARVARVVNQHNYKHMPTCYKGNRRTCRFGFPKEQVPVSFFDPVTGGIRVKRTNSWANTFNEILTFCVRSNTDIK